MIKICKTDKFEIRRLEFSLFKGRYFIYHSSVNLSLEKFKEVNNNDTGYESLEDAKVRMLLESI